MALMHVNFFSQALGLCVSADVLLPQPPAPRDWNSPAWPERKHQVLWLLHGMSDDHTIWQRRTSIERYVDPLGLAVVMPAVDLSWYTDMAHGNRYGTYVSEELPSIMRSFFPLSDRREDNFVAGLSMGGYGALKLALTHPERYAAAASLSGATDIAREAAEANDPAWADFLRRIFGDDLKTVAGSRHDLFHLAGQVAASAGPKPRLYQCCGTEDFLYQANLRFRDHVRQLGLDLTYEEGPGTHEWGYWDRQIQHVLAWLPLRQSVPEAEPAAQPAAVPQA
jgi:putative tributyrin esterase